MQESVDSFFEKIHNEFNISLRAALREFTEYHVYSCNYLGLSADPKDLSLYYQFDYDSEKNFAKLEKVFFVSPEARHILTNNFLLDIDSYTKSKVKKCANKLRQKDSPKSFKFETSFKGLTFFADYNKLENFKAKKILLEYSWLREQNKQLLLLKNLNQNYEDEALREVIIKFDLSFLKDSHFFENDKYSSFKKILPPNLIIELPITLEYEIESVPESLKKEQMVDLNSLKMNIS